MSTVLTLEICRIAVSNVRGRSDLATLCRVSKGFRTFAERALYNTVYMRDIHETLLLCRTISNSAHIAPLVDALTIYATGEGETVAQDSDSEQEEHPTYELPDDYWDAIASALEQVTSLRYLNVHITNSANASAAWALEKCTFQLRGFHCDFNWDHHLISFLNKQTMLNDLYLLDYVGGGNLATGAEAPDTPPVSPPLAASALPALSTLECTFSEAAVVVVPRRPIERLKTCFSCTHVPEKREEMNLLMSKIRQSTRSLRSLDIGDSEYTVAFSMEILSSIVSSRTASLELKYLGTLVLPISGREVSVQSNRHGAGPC